MSVSFNIPDFIGDATVGDLPEPTGWNLLIAMPAVGEISTGGVFLPDVLKEREQAASVVGCVLKAGPLCYQDKSKFGDAGPWCKEGDWVLLHKYSGTRFTVDIEGQPHEMRLIEDRQVEAVVPVPKIIRRV